MSGSSTSSRADDVHQANLATFRAFRKTIDEIIHWPSAPLGDQAGLVRRIQEWRKAIGHITLWVGDARAYYGRARPEIVYLLEAAYDSVCTVDRARSAKYDVPLLQVSNREFTEMLSDYIRLIEAAFGLQRQSLYTTPADKASLERGKVLFNGLHTFRHRLETMRGQQRRASAQQLHPPASQPVSPATPTHPMNSAANIRPPAPTGAPPGPNPHQGGGLRINQFVPMEGQVRRQSTGEAAPARRSFITQPLPKKPQSTLQQLRIASTVPANQAPAPRWNQPVVQQIPTHGTHVPAPPQGPPQAPASFITVPSSEPPVPVQDPPPYTASPTMETGPGELGLSELDLTWEELEALDRSEWENGPGQVDDSVNDNGPILAEKVSGVTDHLQPSSELGPTIKEEINEPSMISSSTPVTLNAAPVEQPSSSLDLPAPLGNNSIPQTAPEASVQMLAQGHVETIDQPPSRPSELVPIQPPTQISVQPTTQPTPQASEPQPESARLPPNPIAVSIVPKEEVNSPPVSQLLHTPPPVDAPMRNLQALERRKSLMAAEVIDIDELSSDDSEPDIPLMSARGAPPVRKPAPPEEIIDIDDTDDEMEIDETRTQPQVVTSSELNRGVDPTMPTNTPTEHVGMIRKASAPISASRAETGAATGGSKSMALPGSSIQGSDLPGVERTAAANRTSTMPGSATPITNVSESQATATSTMVGNEDHEMEVEAPPESRDDPSSVIPANQSFNLPTEALQQTSSDDAEMVDVTHEIAESNNALKDAVDIRTLTEGPLRSSPLPVLPVRDVTTLSPELRLRIRKIMEEPFINYYHPLNPSLTRSAVKEKFDHISDQELLNLYTKLKPVVEHAARLKDERKSITEIKAATGSPALAVSSNQDTPAESSTPPHTLAHQAGSSQPQPAHTATQAASSPIPEPQPKPARKFTLPQLPAPEMPIEPPVLLCSFPGASRLDKGTVEFMISADTMASLERWRTRFVTPAGSHGELVTVELACYPKDALHPPAEGEASSHPRLSPNVQTRTWPDGGILWAFVNNETRSKEQEVRMFLSPPPFVALNESVDISDFVHAGTNTVQFVHLGGMANFIFVVQARKMPPPSNTWPDILKIVKQIPLHLENPRFVNLLTQLNNRPTPNNNRT